MTAAANTIEEALARAQGGDRAAFAQLVREHQSMVFSLGLHFLRNREMAEDMAQDVFLSLYEHLPSIQSAAHLTFWLRRTASNRCIDFGRRQKRQAAVGLDGIAEPSAAEATSDVFGSAAIRRMMAALPEKPRMILTLRYQDDLDPTEIAQVLDIPLNTVKSQLHRSIALLREKLERSRVRS